VLAIAGPLGRRRVSYITEHPLKVPPSRSARIRIGQTCGKNLINSDFEVAGQAVYNNHQELLDNWYSRLRYGDPSHYMFFAD
jgi:hypothetical protein